MEIKKLQALVIDALEDVKAQELRLYDTTHLTSLFERVVIATGTSNRQTRALAASVRDKVKEAGGNVVGIEGEDTGEWVLVDLGMMLVHIMQAPIRAYYRLEEIWGDKEIKLGAAKRAKKTAEDAPKVSRHLTALQGEEAAAPKRRSSKKAAEAEAEAPAPKRRSVKKVEAETAAAPVKKPRTRKAAAADEGAISSAVQQVVAEVAAKKPRARKAASEDTAVAAPAPKIARGARVKVAQAKSVEAELKEIKAAKTAARKKAETGAEKAAPAKRVIRRTKSDE